IALLDAILVNGYGSAYAIGTITSSGTNVSDGDTVVIGSITYTFKTSIAGQLIYSVLIGASAAASLTNLQAAINETGTRGTTYVTGTLPNFDVWASAVTATVLTLTARRGGTAGNSLALSKTAATLTVGAFAGGSGTNSVAGAGW